MFGGCDVYRRAFAAQIHTPCHNDVCALTEFVELSALLSQSEHFTFLYDVIWKQLLTLVVVVVAVQARWP